MEDLPTETSSGAPQADEAPDGPAAPDRVASFAANHDDDLRRRWILPVAIVPLVALLLLVIGWAVDANAGVVPRNVRLAGRDISGLGEDELAGRIGEIAQDFESMPVEITVDDTTYSITAGELGLTVDEAGTATAALEKDDSTFVLLRPFTWARSLLFERATSLRFHVNQEQVAATVVELEGTDRTAPTEPTVELVDGRFDVLAGSDGDGIDPQEVVRQLPAAAQVATDDGDDTISLRVSRGPIPPLGSVEAARNAADAAEALVAEPVEIRTVGGNRTISSDEVRSWVALASRPDGTVIVTFDQPKVAAGLRRAFEDVEGHPVNASFTLENGTPVIIPDQPGKVCCGDGTGTQILTALESGSRSVELPLVDGPAPFTTASAERYGIVQAVGGNNAWRGGAPTTAEAGFTTYHDPTGARITNIHRIADLVRGVVIAPGASFSINDHVGKRTAENGFVTAGAISNGEHVDEIGGGISQFATTTFNAAYFAGLPIDVYQAHSEYFSRYPRGREATMGFPAPDLRFTNDTPYGIMIWTSYTQTSLTVTLYSTPYANAAQTGIAEGTSGKCTTVKTTRTITYPDGRTAQDDFRARYRPPGSTTC